MSLQLFSRDLGCLFDAVFIHVQQQHPFFLQILLRFDAKAYTWDHD